MCPWVAGDPWRKSDPGNSLFLVLRFWDLILCQMTAYDETLIATNFQVEVTISF